MQRLHLRGKILFELGLALEQPVALFGDRSLGRRHRVFLLSEQLELLVEQVRTAFSSRALLVRAQRPPAGRFELGVDFFTAAQAIFLGGNLGLAPGRLGLAMGVGDDPFGKRAGSLGSKPGHDVHSQEADGRAHKHADQVVQRSLGHFVFPVPLGRFGVSSRSARREARVVPWIMRDPETST